MYGFPFQTVSKVGRQVANSGKRHRKASIMQYMCDQRCEKVLHSLYALNVIVAGAVVVVVVVTILLNQQARGMGHDDLLEFNWHYFNSLTVVICVILYF